jgi:protein TonB
MAVVGMPDSEYKGASPNSHLLIGEMPAPHTLQTSSWQATTVTVVAHALVLGLLIYGATHVKQIVQAVQDPMKYTNVIFPDTPGPGGGGGGRPEPKVAPPKKAELLPQKVEVAPVPKPADVPDLNIAMATPEATTTSLGALANSNGLSIPGGGTGNGIGTGKGNGIGPGEGGGTGGGFYQVGNGVTSPVLIKEVKPNYTGDAMRAKLQGTVEMEAVVLPNGSIDPKSLRITRSLDSTFGLDEEAKKAVIQWRFRPGMRQGQAVAVQILVELSFTLR